MPCVFFLFYMFAGYPLLLSWWAFHSLVAKSCTIAIFWPQQVHQKIPMFLALKVNSLFFPTFPRDLTNNEEFEILFHTFSLLFPYFFHMFPCFSIFFHVFPYFSLLFPYFPRAIQPSSPNSPFFGRLPGHASGAGHPRAACARCHRPPDRPSSLADNSSHNSNIGVSEYILYNYNNILLYIIIWYIYIIYQYQYIYIYINIYIYIYDVHPCPSSFPILYPWPHISEELNYSSSKCLDMMIRHWGACHDAGPSHPGLHGHGPWWGSMSNLVYQCTLWLFNIAMENGLFIDGLPIKNGDFP